MACSLSPPSGGVNLGRFRGMKVDISASSSSLELSALPESELVIAWMPLFVVILLLELAVLAGILDKVEIVEKEVLRRPDAAPSSFSSVGLGDRISTASITLCCDPAGLMCKIGPFSRRSLVRTISCSFGVVRGVLRLVGEELRLEIVDEPCEDRRLLSPF